MAILWLVLYYASKEQAGYITRYLFVFMAAVSLIAALYYHFKDE